LRAIYGETNRKTVREEILTLPVSIDMAMKRNLGVIGDVFGTDLLPFQHRKTAFKLVKACLEGSVA
jgi:predicted AAA+ superfamily ATPase